MLLTYGLVIGYQEYISTSTIIVVVHFFISALHTTLSGLSEWVS